MKFYSQSQGVNSLERAGCMYQECWFLNSRHFPYKNLIPCQACTADVAIILLINAVINYLAWGLVGCLYQRYVRHHMHGGDCGMPFLVKNWMSLRLRTICLMQHKDADGPTFINPLTPNDPYSGRTAPLTSNRYILYIYSTNIGT